jgi:hypothetical protein
MKINSTVTPPTVNPPRPGTMTAVHKMENYFGQHPLVGTIISGVHVAAAFVLQIVERAMDEHAHLPPIFMEGLQAGAWLTAIAAGTFTCYGVYRTHHGKKKGKR